MNVRVTNLPGALVPNVKAPTVTLTITGSAQTLAQAGLVLDPGTKHLMVSVEGAPVRTCPEGTAATSSLGQLLNPGDVIWISAAEAAFGSWIRTGATSGTLQVSQFNY